MPRNATESGSREPSDGVIYDDLPHPVFILTQSWRFIVIGLLMWGLLIWIDGQLPGYGIAYLGWFMILLIILRIILAAIDRAVRVQRLTERRVIARFGILSTVRSEMVLDKVQHLIVVRTLVERIFGIGSIGISSAGTGGIELVWRGVERPETVRELIRQTVARHGSGKRGDQPVPNPRTRTMPVIGLVGGIGSGKSTVARAFADLGCAVSDSDKAGAEALRDPEVVKKLVEWWGDEILDKSGGVDRKKVASIVFHDREARSKLEGLVHPMIHAQRRAFIESCRSKGDIRAVIVDAPLLYEAGVDSECDAVVFVQTPKRIRTQRVQETRGWDEMELDRREKAQLGLEHKQERADYRVANGGSIDELPAQVTRILEEIEHSIDDSKSGSEGS